MVKISRIFRIFWKKVRLRKIFNMLFKIRYQHKGIITISTKIKILRKLRYHQLNKLSKLKFVCQHSIVVITNLHKLRNTIMMNTINYSKEK